MVFKTKIIKEILFSLFCFFLAAVFWYMLSNLFLWREGSVVYDLILASIFFSLFFIFSMIYLLLIDNRKVVMISSVFIAFSFLFFFLRKDGMWVGIPAVIGYIASTLILFAAYNYTNKNMLHERKNTIVFHPGKFILKSGPMLLIIFALLISVIFYFNFPLASSEGKIEIEESIVEKTTRPIGGVINNFMPIYDFDMSVDEFIVLISILGLPFAQMEGEEPEPLIDMENPPREIVDYFMNRGIHDMEEINFVEYLQQDEEFKDIFFKAIKEIASGADATLMNEYRMNLSRNWDIKISSTDKMGTVYTNLINSKINQIPDKIRNLILILPSIILFGLLQISFLILNFIYSFLGWAILIVFYKLRFYRIKKVKIEKEEIEL